MELDLDLVRTLKTHLSHTYVCFVAVEHVQYMCKATKIFLLVAWIVFLT